MSEILALHGFFSISKQPLHLHFSGEGGGKRGILEKYVNDKCERTIYIQKTTINVDMAEIPKLPWLILIQRKWPSTNARP